MQLKNLEQIKTPKAAALKATRIPLSLKRKTTMSVLDSFSSKLLI